MRGGPVGERESLSVGQVAARWGCGRQRVHSLIRAGKLTAFTLPATGPYHPTLRIPRAAVLAAEAAWAELPEAVPVPRPKARPRTAELPRLKHLRLPGAARRAEQSA
jgi:hypothetical protein